MSGHTPGPWFVEEQADPCVVNVEFDGGGSDGATVCGNDAVGNARLIAAAPELLAAVEWALGEWQRQEPPTIFIEAIARAKGETE